MAPALFWERFDLGTPYFTESFKIGATGAATFGEHFDVLQGVQTTAFAERFDVRGDARALFSEQWDLGTKTRASFSEEWDIRGATRRPQIGLTPHRRNPITTTSTGPISAGATSTTVTSGSFARGDLVSFDGRELRYLSKVTGSVIEWTVPLENSYSTVISTVTGFALGVHIFDKAGVPLGVIEDLQFGDAPSWMIKERASMRFAVPKNAGAGAALLASDHLVAFQLTSGGEVWAGPIDRIEYGEGQIDVTLQDAFALATGFPVILSDDSTEPIAWTIYQMVVDAMNTQKGLDNELLLGFAGTGTKVFHGTIDFDGDGIDLFGEIADKSDTEFYWEASLGDAGLAIQIVVADRFDTLTGPAIDDGDGGIVSQPRWTEDPSTIVNGIRISGIAADIGQYLPDWAQWAIEDADIAPTAMALVDPGPYRRRVTNDVNVDFGFGEDQLRAIAAAIEAQLWQWYNNYCSAFHDQFGRPNHPGWQFQGPPANLEDVLHTGRGYRTWLRICSVDVPWTGALASAVMRSRSEGKLLVVTYNPITAVQHVRLYYNNQAGSELQVTQMAINGKATIYDYDSGVLVNRRRAVFDHAEILVSPRISMPYPFSPDIWETELTEFMTESEVNVTVAFVGDNDPDTINAPATPFRIMIGRERIRVWFKQRDPPEIGGLVRGIDDTTADAHPDGASVREYPTGGYKQTAWIDTRRALNTAWEGTYFKMETPDPGGTGTPYMTFSKVDAPGPEVEVGGDLIEGSHRIERRSIRNWDPRRDGIGVYTMQTAVVNNQPVRKMRWKFVPFGVGVDGTASLELGINANTTTVYLDNAYSLPPLGPEWDGYAVIGSDPFEEIVLVTDIHGNKLTIVRGQQGTNNVLHEPGEEFTVLGAENTSVFAALWADLTWDTGQAWAESLLGNLLNPMKRLQVFINNENGIWGDIRRGQMCSVSIDSEGPEGIVGTVRILGYSPDINTGAMELVLEWQP